MQLKDSQTGAANQLRNPPPASSPKPANSDGTVVVTPTGQRIELGEKNRQTKDMSSSKT